MKLGGGGSWWQKKAAGCSGHGWNLAKRNLFFKEILIRNGEMVILLPQRLKDAKEHEERKLFGHRIKRPQNGNQMGATWEVESICGSRRREGTRREKIVWPPNKAATEWKSDGRHLGGGVHLLYIYPAEGLAIAAEIRNPKSEIVEKVESIYYAFNLWVVCLLLPKSAIRNPKLKNQIGAIWESFPIDESMDYFQPLPSGGCWSGLIPDSIKISVDQPNISRRDNLKIAQ